MLADVTREQAAKECGVSPAAISQWEMGRTIPGIEHLATLAKLYGNMPLETLMWEMGLPIQSAPITLRQWYKARSEQTGQAASGESAGATGASVASGSDAAALGASYRCFDVAADYARVA